MSNKYMFCDKSLRVGMKLCQSVGHIGPPCWSDQVGGLRVGRYLWRVIAGHKVALVGLCTSVCEHTCLAMVPLARSRS